VHQWLRRYANEGGLGGLADRSSKPDSCPHRMSAAVEAQIVGLRREHPGWGPSRIAWEPGRAGVVPLPGRSSVYRALARHGLVAARKRRRRREDYRRWERGRAMELWQMDVMGRVFLAGGQEVKAAPYGRRWPGVSAGLWPFARPRPSHAGPHPRMRADQVGSLGEQAGAHAAIFLAARLSSSRPPPLGRSLRSRRMRSASPTLDRSPLTRIRRLSRKIGDEQAMVGGAGSRLGCPAILLCLAFGAGPQWVVRTPEKVVCLSCLCAPLTAVRRRIPVMPRMQGGATARRKL
jgi:hypothetical protein